MKYNSVIRKAIFLRRPNRFQAYVILDDEELLVYVPNTGRCREILKEGCTVLLRKGTTPNRKTPYDLIAAYKGEVLINIDSQIPNKVVEEALKNKKIEKLVKFNNISREKTFGNSRFDFKLQDDNKNTYFLEVKGVTLEENGETRFPDAPTERGKKHILELIEIKKLGMGAGIIFLIQIDNVNKFSPNDETDPKFGEALRLAKKEGVDIFAYNCKVTEEEIELLNPVDIVL
ncbi:DNA/RNA nuclease SfsA [Clostridium perfringens]|uniref:Sugar fermentation stimulation protein homolog n=1 Tax=Clostridium perfringens TaxID=1502 RepID=A0A133N9L1_CLOPF|nr:DNA/RNA nuclease SfsA [Clostridium perfringens]KXA12981.1 sugar fermentation stimulation protein [Clostridium perfringens]